MLSTIEYAPVWIIMAVALALGIGTMIGWRRVAMTIGEKPFLISYCVPPGGEPAFPVRGYVAGLE
ncbi:putative low-affinity inorganic phosphate transporter 2 domain protein [Escherichia coli DEC4C]|nr:putative low-affinity inorganic phosphate transporter 2 domain protein [Escherichia coli DEC4C]